MARQHYKFDEEIEIVLPQEEDNIEWKFVSLVYRNY